MSVLRGPVEKTCRAAVLAFVAATATYCGTVDSSDSNPSCVAPVSDEDQAHALYYELAWDDTDVSWHPSGNFVVRSNNGYEVQVTGGELTNYSLQLVECKPDTITTCPAQISLISPVAFAIPSAWAGHPSGETDSSAVQKIYVEPLTSRGFSSYGSSLAAPNHYCRGHYLAGPLPEDIRQPTTNQAGISLWIEGQYRRMGDSTWTPFRWETTIAYGAFPQLRRSPDSNELIHTGKEGGLLSLRRRRATMFDDVLFEGSDIAKQASKVLANLVLQASLHFYPQGSTK